MLDKTLLVAPENLRHRLLGAVVYTEDCARMEQVTGNFSQTGSFASLYVEHDGDIKEVTLSLLSKD